MATSDVAEKAKAANARKEGTATVRSTKCVPVENSDRYNTGTTVEVMETKLTSRIDNPNYYV